MEKALIKGVTVLINEDEIQEDNSSDAVITMLESFGSMIPGFWLNSTSHATFNTVEGQFVDGLSGPATDGRVIFAQNIKGWGRSYDKVFFIVGESSIRIHNYLFDALQEADRQGMTSVSFPEFYMSECYYEEYDSYSIECLTGVYDAVIKFIDTAPKNLKTITILVRGGQKSYCFLWKKFLKRDY